MFITQQTESKRDAFNSCSDELLTSLTVGEYDLKVQPYSPTEQSTLSNSSGVDSPVDEVPRVLRSAFGPTSGPRRAQVCLTGQRSRLSVNYMFPHVDTYRFMLADGHPSLSFVVILTMVYSGLCSNLSRPSDFREPTLTENDDTLPTPSASLRLWSNSVVPLDNRRLYPYETCLMCHLDKRTPTTPLVYHTLFSPSFFVPLFVYSLPSSRLLSSSLAGPYPQCSFSSLTLSTPLIILGNSDCFVMGDE